MGKLSKKNKNTKEGKDKQLKQQLAELERKDAAKKRCRCRRNILK